MYRSPATCCKHHDPLRAGDHNRLFAHSASRWGLEVRCALLVWLCSHNRVYPAAVTSRATVLGREESVPWVALVAPAVLC